MSLKNWSTTPGSNTSAPPDGAPESSTKIKDFNDLIRQVMAKVRCLAAPVTIASAATTDLGASDETIQTISGTTTITAFGTVSSGIWKLVTFSGALTLTHNATSLILLGGANRTTVAGDCGLYVSLGSGNWKEYFYSPIGAYQPLDAALTSLAGLSLAAGDVLYATAADTLQRLAKGTALQRLRMNAAATAPEWAATTYASAEQVITAGGTLTIAHGLGASPVVVSTYIVCQTAESGYSIGDKLLVNGSSSNSTTTDRGHSIVFDATNFVVRFSDSATCYSIINKTTGALAATTNANWKLVITAVA